MSRLGEITLFNAKMNLGSVFFAANSRLSPLPLEPPGYRGAIVDIPLDGAKDTKAKERELQAKEAELKKREHVLQSSYVIW
ncbi:unnamed protein product, partial [Vitis vinifera]|uniref:Uncharacterized protein n=1 Tax=Vitis vinifera TaxID=29760 RepID=D7SXY8_VITVI